MIQVSAIFTIILVFTILINPAFAITQLDRVDITNPRLVNAFGSKISERVNVNQQVQISADIKNNQEKDQEFAYIVQIKNQNNIIMSINWVIGSLDPGQTFSPALSWIPKASGEYTVEIFVWDVENIVNNDGKIAKIIKNDALAQYATLKIIS
ncbi:MAG: CARDB domain-containing protein [Nitrosarchaeum sp.]